MMEIEKRLYLLLTRVQAANSKKSFSLSLYRDRDHFPRASLLLVRTSAKKEENELKNFQKLMLVLQLFSR